MFKRFILAVYHHASYFSFPSRNLLLRVSFERFFVKFLSSSLNVSKPLKMIKIDSAEFKNIFTPELHTLLALFKKYNYEIRIAGGAVRDILMGQTPHDVDFATTATPTEMKEMFEAEEIRMINTKGEKHGTITARINDQNFEVTTLRIDVATDGRHAEVEFTTDWALDAGRRDLTINSLFLDAEGIVYDYFDGAVDVKNHRIVFVGDPAQRIKEDYLRILRYFRFYGRIASVEDGHEEDTISAIKDNISGLGRVSGERIWVELSKIASGRFACSLLIKLIEVGATDWMGLPQKPNITEMKLVFMRSKGCELKPMTVISSLLRSIEEVMAFNARVKLSTAEKNLGIFIIEHRNDEKLLLPLKRLLMTPQKFLVTRVQISELLKYWGEQEMLLTFESWPTPRFPVHGNTLLKEGVPPGASLGRVMDKLKMSWVDSEFKLTSEELIQELPSVCENLNIKMIKIDS